MTGVILPEFLFTYLSPYSSHLALADYLSNISIPYSELKGVILLINSEVLSLRSVLVLLRFSLLVGF